MAVYCDTPRVLVLTLGSLTLDLMDAANGFLISEVDLGWPAVRENTDDRPAAHGQTDFTRFFSARVVSITGALIPSTAGSRGQHLHALAPFLDPGARPVLRYQMDADTVVRQIRLRATALSAPYNHPTDSDWAVQWKAADPFAYDDTAHVVYVGPYTASSGRAYNLTYNRIYPAGAATSAVAQSNGDMPAYPTFTLYGPASSVVITCGGTVTFKPAFTLAAGSQLVVDCQNRTVIRDGAYSEFGNVDFANTAWPILQPGVAYPVLLQASGYAAQTQLVATWRDAWLL